MHLGGNLSQEDLVHFIPEDIGGEAKIEHIDTFGEFEEAIRGTTIEESTEQGHDRRAA